MLARSLATRLALASCAVALLLLAVGTVLFWPRLIGAVEQGVRDHTRSLASTVAASYGVVAAGSEDHPVAEAIDEVSRTDFVVSVEVRDPTGKVLHHFGPSEPGGHLVEVRRPLPGRADCARCHPGSHGARGEVRVVADVDRAAAGLLTVHRLALTVMVLAVLGALLAVAVFARRLMIAPLVALTETMSRAEEGDFLVRAPTERADEIGMVARAFNKMLAAITGLQAERLEQAQDLAQAQQALAVQREIEERNQVIAETNDRLERRVEELTLLTDMTRAVTSTLDLRQILDEVTRRVGTFMGVDEVALLMAEQRQRRLRVMSTYGLPDPEALRGLRFNFGEGISGRVAQSGHALLVRDTAQDARYLHYKGLRPADGSFLSVPLIAKGKVVGVLDFFRAQPDAFDEASVTLLTAVAGQAALAIQNARLYKAQTNLALTDALTGLPNRRALDLRALDELERAERFGNDLSALMIDVDYFKQFNDQHGHLLGDLVLKQVSRSLRRQLRRVDTLARFGGEEFCVLLVRTSQEQAREVAEKLRRTVAERTYARIRSDLRLSITVSIGVASYDRSMQTPQALLDAADGALYEAKRLGRNRVCVAGASAG